MKKCDVCGGDVIINSSDEGTSSYMPINKTTDGELLELIHKDLKMRAVDGVVDISDFIWMKLVKRIGEQHE